MKNLALAFAVFALVLAAVVGWQVGTCVLANMELRDDMQDIASQIGGRIGLTQVGSDDEFCTEILRRAQRDGIELAADQVSVQRTGSHPNEGIFLAVDYTRQIGFFGWSYTLHFTPEARKQFTAGDWRL